MVSVIVDATQGARTTSTWNHNQPFRDITRGRVDLDVRWIDQSTSLSLPSWTVANVANLSITHLGGHTHL